MGVNGLIQLLATMYSGFYATGSRSKLVVRALARTYDFLHMQLGLKQAIAWRTMRVAVFMI